MTVKDQIKKPGWYGIATGAIGLAVAIVGYLDTRAKAQRAEMYRVEADTAIIENLSGRVEELEETLVEIRISLGILEGTGLGAIGSGHGGGGGAFAPVYLGEETSSYGEAASEEATEEAVEEVSEEPDDFVAEETFSAEVEHRAAAPDPAPAPTAKQTKSRKDTRELKELIQQRAY